MYPESPVKAPIVADGPEVATGNATSVTVIRDNENTAYSPAGYAKHARSLSIKVMTRGECGSGYS